MYINKISLTTTVAAMMLLASCMDNNYDLKQIEGSKVRIAVNELTVPVRTDAITLDSILSLNDSSIIKRVNGAYAAVKEDIIKESEDVKIDEIIITKPNDVVIEKVIRNGEINPIFDPSGGALVIDENEDILDINIPNASNTLTMNATNIDNAVRSISKIGLSKTASLEITLKFSNVSGVKSFSVRQLSIQLPLGLTATANHGGIYDPSTGIVTFNEEITSSNLAVGVKLDIIAISNSTDFEFVPGAEKGVKESKGRISMAREIKVVGGKIHVKGGDLETRTIAGVNQALANDHIDYLATAKFNEDIAVNTFSGDVYYVIDGINVSPVVLNDLPSILNQTGTEIGLDNPQLYISVNNPILQMQPTSAVIPTAEFGLKTRTSGKLSDEMTPEGKIEFAQANNSLVLAPKPEGLSYESPTNPDFKFTNNTEVRFTKMSNLLKGQNSEGESRLPDSILVRIEPKVEQTVNDLKLMNYGRVSGKYAFYAPLKFTENSKIVYNDTIDGMNTETVDKMVVDKLVLNAAISTDMPVNSLTLELIPFEYTNEWTDNFDKETRPKKFRNELRQEIIISPDGSGFITNRTFLVAFDPMVKGVPSIQHLAGIVLNARINASDKSDLKPSQKINITDIKASVTGYYDTKL